MKRQVIVFGLVSSILILLSFSCGRKTYSTAKVNYLSDKEGTITARAIGVGNNEAEAYTNAIFNVFDVLFFRGLPESNQKVALIGTNENEERSKNTNYFDEFYNERYETFVMSVVPSGDLMKSAGGKKSIAVDIKINLDALRTDLEENNIIRKFGY